ncbi:hypothetical protein [Streptomyces sp. NPDC056682]|uniref:hypothetical protein n=1 Tax=Streptomyces sp. NPDC056682 TaxID=3345909 RepID=UPI0036AF55EA
MPSVVGLLEQHELAARRRVDGLREEADRVQAELAVAEQEWQEWAIARRRVGTVLAPDDGNVADQEAAAGSRNADSHSAPRQAAKPKSQVPVWREGLDWSVLSVDYQRILSALADRHRLHQGPLTCQELAVVFGLERSGGTWSYTRTILAVPDPPVPDVPCCPVPTIPNAVLAAESSWGVGRPIDGSHKRQNLENHTRRPWVGEPYEGLARSRRQRREP